MDFNYIHIEFDSSQIDTIAINQLPDDWQKEDEHPECKRIGDTWISTGATPVLAVPSAVISSETNYLLNPAHPDFRRINVGPPQSFLFDKRLIK